MSTRPLHVATSPAVAERQAAFHADVIAQVREAVATHDVVVVGMAWNPHVKKATSALNERGIAHQYLEFGSYAAKWKERLAIKMYTGWPTFPQVFVRGTLVGGNSDLHKALADGSIRTLLDTPRS